MRRITGILTLILVASSLILAQQARIDQEAPDFTLTDSKGETHSLSDFEGKYVVLEWINFGCPFVQKHYESGNMQSLQEKYTEKGVVWLTICSSAPGKQGHRPPEEINEMMEKWNGNHTAYLIDESGKVGNMYGAKTTPHMYIINPEGKLVYAGAIDSIPSADKDDIDKATNYVSKALDQAMSGEKITDKVTKPYGCSVKY